MESHERQRLERTWHYKKKNLFAYEARSKGKSKKENTVKSCPSTRNAWQFTDEKAKEGVESHERQRLEETRAKKTRANVKTKKKTRSNLVRP